MSLPNTFREWISSFDKPVDVIAKKPIEDCELYAEAGMKMTIWSVRKSKYVGEVSVTVSFEKFDKFNEGFESTNYFDNQGNPVLTCKEKGFFHMEESYYFNDNANPNDVFSSINALTPLELNQLIVDVCNTDFSKLSAEQLQTIRDIIQSKV